MGVYLSAVRSEAKKQSDEVEKIVTDSVNSLVDLAKLQTVLFRAQAKDQTEFRINVSKFLREDTVIKCNVKTDGKALGDHIMKVYKAFVNKDFAAALGETLGTALDGLIGSAAANSNEESKYFISVGKLGYPFRIDMHLYTYKFTSSTITKVSQNILAVSLLVSSCNLSNLTESDLGPLVELCYDSASEEDTKKILAKLIEARNKQIQEKKDAASGSKTDGGTDTKKAAFSDSNKATLFDGMQDLGGVKQGLEIENSHAVQKELHDAWKEAMKEEGVIPSYQPREVPAKLRSLLGKLN